MDLNRIERLRKQVCLAIPNQIQYPRFPGVHEEGRYCRQGGRRAIHRALRPDGTFVLSDFGPAAKLEENLGSEGAFMYSVSVLYCMTLSLSQGGAGLGTAGLSEGKVRELCAKAGFASVRRLPFEDSAVYEVKP